VKRLVRDNELAADAFIAGKQMGKIVLFRDRATQIVVGDEAQSPRRLAEPQSPRLLQLHDPLDVLGAELSLFRENAADATLVTPKNAPRCFDCQHIFLRFHRHFSARIRQSPSGAAQPTEQTPLSGLPGVEHGKQRNVQGQVAARAHPAVEHLHQHHERDSEHGSDHQ
jgi:hypothetical protein